MKIGVIGATGHSGSLIAQKGLAAGLQVTALVRNAGKLTFEVPVIEKDILALSKADIADLDAVVMAFKAPFGQEELYVQVINHLIEILDSPRQRLVVVGATSSLYLNAAHTRRYLDAIPARSPIYPTAKNMTAMVDLLKASAVNYTYFSPASYFIPAGVETGDYTIAGDVYEENAAGENKIAYADYAQAVINFLQSGDYQRAHISIYNN